MAGMSTSLPDPAWKTWWDSAPRPPLSPDAWWAERERRVRAGWTDDEDADALLDLLRRILVLEPTARPSAAEIAQDRWLAALSGDDIMAGWGGLD